MKKNKLRVLASLSLAATVGLTGVSTATVSANVTQPEADTPLIKEKLQKLSVKSVQKQQYTGEQPLETLILDTYVDGKVDYTFYEDDASTEDYKDGAYNETNFIVKRKKNSIEFNIDKKNEGFKDSKLNQVTLKVHNAEEPKKVKAASTKFKQVDSIEHVNDSTNTYFYDKESKTLYVGVSIDETKKVKMK